MGSQFRIVSLPPSHANLRVAAVYFEPRTPSQLFMRVGDIVRVLHADTQEWSLVENVTTQLKGYVPHVALEPLPAVGPYTASGGLSSAMTESATTSSSTDVDAADADTVLLLSRRVLVGRSEVFFTSFVCLTASFQTLSRFQLGLGHARCHPIYQTTGLPWKKHSPLKALGMCF